jgi:hypothetical protein
MGAGRAARAGVFGFNFGAARLGEAFAGFAAVRLGRETALRAGAFFCFDRTLVVRLCFANPIASCRAWLGGPK